MAAELRKRREKKKRQYIYFHNKFIGTIITSVSASTHNIKQNKYDIFYTNFNL
jgi:hypothetical protein